MPNSVFPGGAPGLSPTKSRPAASPQKLPGLVEQDSDSATRDLLERMKQMVETKRGRNSAVPTHPDETGRTPIPVNLKEELQETPSLADDEASPDPPGGQKDQDSGDEESLPKQKGRLLRSKAAKELAQASFVDFEKTIMLFRVQAQEIDIPIKKTVSTSVSHYASLFFRRPENVPKQWSKIRMLILTLPQLTRLSLNAGKRLWMTHRR